MATAQHDPWLTVTRDKPEPLRDVIVSAYSGGDEKPLTYMAYRKRQGSWMFFISGTEEPLHGVYAYCAGPEPAPLTMKESHA